MIKRVYVEQFGHWWGFTSQQYREWLEKTLHDYETAERDEYGLKYFGFTLPEERQLKHRPRKVKVMHFDGEPHYVSDDPTARVARLLNWELEDFEDELHMIKRHL